MYNNINFFKKIENIIIKLYFTLISFRRFLHYRMESPIFSPSWNLLKSFRNLSMGTGLWWSSSNCWYDVHLGFGIKECWGVAGIFLQHLWKLKL